MECFPLIGFRQPLLADVACTAELFFEPYPLLIEAVPLVVRKLRDA